MVIRAFYTLIIFLFPNIALAAATGLVTIPTAEVLPPSNIDIGIAFQYADSTSEATLESQIGLAKGLEAGYDLGWINRPEPNGFNVKKALRWRDDDAVLSLGIQNIRNDLKIQPYAVGRVPAYRSWLHAGVILIDSQIQPMLGYDRYLSDNLNLQIDFIGGSDNGGSIGLAFDRNDLCINAAYIYLNSGSNRSGIYLSVNRIFSLQP